jgi:hypothetical protein
MNNFVYYFSISAHLRLSLLFYVGKRRPFFYAVKEALTGYTKSTP